MMNYLGLISLWLLLVVTTAPVGILVNAFQVGLHPTFSSSMLRRSFTTTTSNHHLLFRMSSSSSSESGPTSSSVVEEDNNNNKVVPITLLAGFLGSGKTTTLQHLLDNTQGVKIGIVVNDMSSVNVDAKVVVSSHQEQVTTNGIVELQNGCACCSLADELLTSIDALLANQKNLDALVVELSGVADPMSIKSNWETAKTNGHPVTQKAHLSQVVTLIDASTFGTDWMSNDMTAGDNNRDQQSKWIELDHHEMDGCGGGETNKNRRNNIMIPELLAEQVEAADIVLINKKDLAGPEQVKVVSSMIQTINKNAKITVVEYGRVIPEAILPPQQKELNNTPKQQQQQTEEEEDDDDDNGIVVENIDEMSLDQLKSLLLDLLGEGEEENSSIPESATLEEARDIVWDYVLEEQQRPHDDNEEDHDDESSSSASSRSTTSIDQLGITNFVYKANRPFNPTKLLSILKKSQWPVPTTNRNKKDDDDFLDLDLSSLLMKEAQHQTGYDDGEVKGEYDNNEASPFVGVLRSKGFCWFAPPTQYWYNTNGIDDDVVVVVVDDDDDDDDNVWKLQDTVMYWSHAGLHFDITAAGNWYNNAGAGASSTRITTREQMEERRQNDLDECHNNKQTLKKEEEEDNNDVVVEISSNKEFGDQRQEIVFIGVGLDQNKIKEALDDCLLTDIEMGKYREELTKRFSSTMII